MKHVDTVSDGPQAEEDHARANTQPASSDGQILEFLTPVNAADGTDMDSEEHLDLHDACKRQDKAATEEQQTKQATIITAGDTSGLHDQLGQQNGHDAGNISNVEAQKCTNEMKAGQLSSITAADIGDIADERCMSQPVPNVPASVAATGAHESDTLLEDNVGDTKQADSDHQMPDALDQPLHAAEEEQCSTGTTLQDVAPNSSMQKSLGQVQQHFKPGTGCEQDVHSHDSPAADMEWAQQQEHGTGGDTEPEPAARKQAGSPDSGAAACERYALEAMHTNNNAEDTAEQERVSTFTTPPNLPKPSCMKVLCRAFGLHVEKCIALKYDL